MDNEIANLTKMEAKFIRTGITPIIYAKRQLSSNETLVLINTINEGN